MRRTRVATREISAEPWGECSRIHRQRQPRGARGAGQIVGSRVLRGWRPGSCNRQSAAPNERGCSPMIRQSSRITIRSASASTPKVGQSHWAHRIRVVVETYQQVLDSEGGIAWNPSNCDRARAFRLVGIPDRLVAACGRRCALASQPAASVHATGGIRAIVEPILAKEDRLYRRLHVVVDVAPAGSLFHVLRSG